MHQTTANYQRISKKHNYQCDVIIYIVMFFAIKVNLKIKLWAQIKVIYAYN